MKKLFILAAFCAMTFGVFSISTVLTTQGQTNNCKCAEDALADAQKLQVGGTREDVEKMFTQDGGLSLIEKPRFIYRGCSSIKIDITFDLVDKSNSHKDSPKDKIVAVSKPYLEHAFLN